MSRSKSPSTNIQLNWLLVGYQYPDAVPGVVAKAPEAQKTLKELEKRAKFEALLRGVPDHSVADEALSKMLAWVAASQLTSRFQSERGTPRRYINKILARFVQREIHDRRHKSKNIANDEPAASTLDPAKEVEIKELTAICAARLKGDRTDSIKGSPDEPRGRHYVRKHRVRRRRWSVISDLFPGVSFRPKKRLK